MAEEVPDNTRTHVERHAKRSAEDVDPYKLRVKFSAHMQKDLEKVIAEVRRVGRSEEDDLTRRLIPDLQELLSGKIRLVTAMHHMGDLGRQLQRHTRLTGDGEAESKWQYFVLGMYRNPSTGPKPFTLSTDKTKGTVPSMG